MDESPTRYLLPPEEDEHPPVETKKRKKKKDKKKSKKTKEEEFDADAFLETLSKQTQTEEPAFPMCALHPEEFMERRQGDTQYGRWEYYKCPVQGCFVCCGVDDQIHAPGEKDNVQYYLDSVKRQLHEFYRRLPLDKIKCFCDRPLIMTMSHSEKNPGRLFLKCSKRWCDFFQWGDEVPRAKNRVWLEEGRKLWLETPLQQGVRRIVDKHLSRVTDPQELSPQTKYDLDRIIPRFKQENYLLDEFTPKEQHYMLKRGLVPPISDSMSH